MRNNDGCRPVATFGRWPRTRGKTGGLDWILLTYICGAVTNCSLTEQFFSEKSQCESDGLQSVICLERVDNTY
jgi:hypothetical protein